MNGMHRLLLECSALLRSHPSPLARRCCAREASQIDTADLVAGAEWRSRILVAIKEGVVASALCTDEQRRFIITALTALVAAVKTEEPAPQFPPRNLGARQYWIEVDR